MSYNLSEKGWSPIAWNESSTKPVQKMKHEWMCRVVRVTYSFHVYANSQNLLFLPCCKEWLLLFGCTVTFSNYWQSSIILVTISGNISHACCFIILYNRHDLRRVQYNRNICRYEKCTLMNMLDTVSFVFKVLSTKLREKW